MIISKKFFRIILVLVSVFIFTPILGIYSANAITDTTPPSGGAIYVPETAYRLSFIAIITGVTDSQSGVASVKFAVWSSNNGQDDLKWYQCSNSGGYWSARLEPLINLTEIYLLY